VNAVLRVAAVVLLVAVLAPALASACPLCKEAASDADKPGATSMWRGMYWSILFMVSAPFAMVGAMIVMVRRAKRNLPAGASSEFRVSGSELASRGSRLET
jgi:hypothetical protein